MRLSSQFSQLNLDPKDFSRTWETVQQGLADGVAPGFVVGIWKKNQPELAYIQAWGKRRLFPSELPMEPDTIFDLASVSKVFATASLCAVLVQRGWIDWDTPVSAVIAGYPHTQIRIRHLLSHTAGLPWWKPLWEMLWKRFHPIPLYLVPIHLRQKAMRSLVLTSELEEAPGHKVVYSDLTFLTLGFLLEEVTQMPFHEAVRRHLWEPMGINEASYRKVRTLASQDIWLRAAATEESAHRGGILQGQVHDDNCWAMGGYGGHSGVFATAREVLHFSRSLLTGFFSPPILEAMSTRVTTPSGCERTLGWDTPSYPVSSAGSRFSSYSIGHLGFTGTSLWIDLDAGIAVTLLSNRVHPSRENKRIVEFRRKFHDSVRMDLGR